MNSAPFPPLTELQPSERIDIEMIYALPDHPDNAFKRLYQSNAKMLLHPTLASIVMTASTYLPEGEQLSLKDGLRTVDAQQGMVAVKNEHGWSDALVSSPGQGGHPRGCAIDIMRLNAQGEEIDAGTPFDDFHQIDGAGNILPDHQCGTPRAARTNPFLTPDQREAQRVLETAMVRAALAHDTLVMPLPQEHWDFRFPETEDDLQHIIVTIGRILEIEIPQSVVETITHYDDFVAAWHSLFADHQARMRSLLGRSDPPDEAGIIFSSRYAPLTDQQLKLLGYPPMTDYT